MCYGCLVAGFDTISLSRTHWNSDQLNFRLIPPHQLISPDFQRFTSQQVVRDGVMDIYLHRPSGLTEINGGGFGRQTIQTLALEDDLYGFLFNALIELDASIDLDFRLVNNPDLADLAFYLDSEINLGDSDGLTLGIALTNNLAGRSFWEVMLNTPAFGRDANYLRYAALHEIGHALGLEHPFDDSDGDFFLSRDPWLSAFPEDTVMAYRSPQGGVWPTAFSANDLAALRLIWGVESEVSKVPLGQRLIGTDSDDILIGGPGPDLLRGEFGNDQLIGGGGGDELWGGSGSNLFRSSADGVEDWMFISRDGPRKISQAAASVDVIQDMGSEDRIGILGARTKQLRFKPVNLESASWGPVDGIGIFAMNRLEAIYTGGDLTRTELRGVTVGLAANFTGDLA
jgi:serralysin